MLNYIAQYEIGTVWIEIARLFFIMSQARYLLGSFYEQVAKRIVNIRLTATNTVQPCRKMKRQTVQIHMQRAGFHSNLKLT